MLDEYGSGPILPESPAPECAPLAGGHLIDPQNPFENPTETPAYNSDYREVVPQIAIPNCEIPLVPSDTEKRSIRRYYNLAGGGLLLLILFSNLIATVLYLVVPLLLKAKDSTTGSLPANYQDIVNQYMTDSSINSAMNLIIFLCSNVAVFLIGCKLTHIKIPSLFQTTRLKLSSLLRYVVLGWFIQLIAVYIAAFLEQAATGFGIYPYEPDFSAGTDSVLKIACTFLYGCIIAPITEELVFRGFFLKNMSRVSQRFGIFASALFFGLMHENLAQFALAFPLGILLGYITTKHNSLVPAIVVHFAINLLSAVEGMLYDASEAAGYTFFVLTGLLVLIGGGILLGYTILKERLPDTMPHQSIRGKRIAFTSWTLWLAAIIYIGAGCYYSGVFSFG